MEVKIKKLCDSAVIPSYAKPGDAGMDLVATSRIFDKYGNVEYGTGLAMEIPEGYVGLLFPRSSISKQDLSLANAVGVIDSGYRGEIKFKFKPTLAYMTFGVATNSKGIDEDSDSFDFVSYASEQSGKSAVAPFNQIPRCASRGCNGDDSVSVGGCCVGL